MMFNNYCFSCPHMSFIVERYSFFFHNTFCLTLSVFVLSRDEVASVVSVRRRSANHFAMIASRKIFPPVPVTPLVPYVPLFFSALMCSVSHLI